MPQEPPASSGRLAGSGIPDPGFAGDTGAAPPELAAALREYAATPGRYPDALAALQSARLLVPVVALLGEVEHDQQGLARDKSSDMATVLLTGRDGRTALLAFTGSDAMRAWDPEARPVPVPAALAARSAVQDGASALLVDVAGPVPLVVQGDDLTGLASGWRLGRVGGRTAWIRPAPE